MSYHSPKSRRSFIKKAISTALISGTTPLILHGAAKNVFELNAARPERKFEKNDNVNVALIGMGIMGFSNAEVTAQIPGVKIVGVCDLYNGRLERSKEILGKDIFTTRDYNEVLNRKDV